MLIHHLLSLEIVGNSRRDGGATTTATFNSRASALSSSILSTAMACKNGGNRWDEAGSLRRLACDRVALSQAIVLLLVECVDICCGELAGRNLLGEEDIEFVECAAFGFLFDR